MRERNWPRRVRLAPLWAANRPMRMRPKFMECPGTPGSKSSRPPKPGSFVTDALGNQIFSGILKPGDIILVPDQDGVVMTAGDSGALSILVDGAKLKPSGPSAGTVTNVPLGAEALLDDEFLAEVAMEPNRIAFGEAR